MSITAEKIGKVFARHKRGLHERDSVTAVEMLERDILSLLQQGEPEGWKLVPVEPTKAMLEAGHCYMPVEYTHEFKDGQHRITLKKRHECVSPALAYQAMLSASPLPPAPGAETDAALEEAYQEGFEAGKIEGRDDAIMVDKDLFRMLSNWVFDKTGTSWSDFPDGLSPHDLIDMLDEHLRCSSQPAVLEEAKDSERAILLARVVGFAVGSAAAEEHAGLISEFERLGFVARRKHYSKVGSWEAYALTDSGFDHLERIASRNLTQRCLRAHIFYLRNTTTTPPAEGETK